MKPEMHDPRQEGTGDREAYLGCMTASEGTSDREACLAAVVQLNHVLPHAPP